MAIEDLAVTNAYLFAGDFLPRRIPAVIHEVGKLPHSTPRLVFSAFHDINTIPADVEGRFASEVIVLDVIAHG